MAWQREVTWRRIDERGEEHCVCACESATCAVESFGAVSIDGHGLAFEYRMQLTSRWEIRFATVVARLGVNEYRVSLEHRGDGAWLVDGTHVPRFAECEDLDLSFTPLTNTIAIKRLGLQVGQEGVSRALWAAEPELTLHVLDQRYRRTGQRTYEYEAGEYSTRLKVDDDGIVVDYPERFRIIRSPVVTA